MRNDADLLQGHDVLDELHHTVQVLCDMSAAQAVWLVSERGHVRARAGAVPEQWQAPVAPVSGLMSADHEHFEGFVAGLSQAPAALYVMHVDTLSGQKGWLYFALSQPAFDVPERGVRRVLGRVFERESLRLVSVFDVSVGHVPQELAQFAVDHANDAIFWVDASGCVVYANYAASKELGLEVKQLIGMSYAQINTQLDQQGWEALWDDLEDVLGLRFDTVHHHKERGGFSAEVSINRINFNEVAYACVFARDISERKQADEELRAYTERLQQSNRELQDFAYVASHDLQEPLRKIQAFGERIARLHGDALDAKGKDYLARMLRASGRMSRLIEDLLRFSRVTTHAVPFEAVDLNEVVRHVLLDLSYQIEETGGEVEVGELPRMMADATQMTQVFQNLISNALKFAREGQAPRIQIFAELQEATENIENAIIPVGTDPELCYHLVVRDNGIGFDVKYADKIFVPFQRLHARTSAYSGTGIGLAIVRKIMERHGGSVSATGEQGQGATFTLELPTLLMDTHHVS